MRQQSATRNPGAKIIFKVFKEKVSQEVGEKTPAWTLDFCIVILYAKGKTAMSAVSRGPLVNE